MVHTYDIYGLRVVSSLNLQGVPLWSAAGSINSSTAGVCHDVVVELGDVPTELEAPFSVADDFQVGAECVLLRIPSVAWYLVRGGREIFVKIMPNADTALVSWHLLHTAMIALCLQRHIFPIRAAAIMDDKGCAVFLGEARSGKSTLVQAFVARGYAILANDILIMSADGQVFPKPFSSFKLAGSESASIPIRGLYRLRWLLPKSAEPEIEPLSAFQALLDLRGLVYWPSLIAAMGCESAFLTFAGRLLSSSRVDEFRRPLRLSGLAAQVETLERHFAKG